MTGTLERGDDHGTGRDNMPPVLAAIPCPRWRAAAAALWARLPDYDRAALAARLAGVRIREDLDKLAEAGDFEDTGGGVLRWYIDVRPADRVGGDDDLLAVFAHECAHVIMRHGEVLVLISVAALRGAYTPGEFELIGTTVELAAWALLQWWGLGDQARAFLRNWPPKSRPAFWRYDDDQAHAGEHSD